MTAFFRIEGMHALVIADKDGVPLVKGLLIANVEALSWLFPLCPEWFIVICFVI